METTDIFHYTSRADLNTWFSNVEFNFALTSVSRDVVQGCIDTLCQCGVLDRNEIREWQENLDLDVIREICHPMTTITQ